MADYLWLLNTTLADYKEVLRKAEEREKHLHALYKALLAQKKEELEELKKELKQKRYIFFPILFLAGDSRSYSSLARWVTSTFLF
jgi:DNA-binding transcriptional MerR regulator